MKEKKPSSVEDFADSIKDNPKEIIEWAEREILEYRRLISILKKKKRGFGYSDPPLIPNTHTSQTQPEQRKV